MQDNSSAFYKRAGALGAATALAVSGAFIASPAIAAPAAGSDTTTSLTAVSEAPAAQATSGVPLKTVTDEATPAEESPADEAARVEEAPAEEAGSLAPGLAEALMRDLGMTVGEFKAAGELGKKAADALPALQAIEGFAGIAIKDGRIVITGSGEALETRALELDAVLVAPVTQKEEPAAPEETPVSADVPAPKATEEAPAGDGVAAPLSLPSDPYAATRAISAHYIANVGVQGLQSVLWDGTGYVISVDKAATVGASPHARNRAEGAQTPADAYAATYADSNIRVVESSGATTSIGDVVNGQGYASPLGGGAYALCSIGFNGFTPTGAPAVITAGHCSEDGSATEAVLTDPTGDAASGNDQFTPGESLGSWVFSQFGGAGNSPINTETLENVGTDIAVIDGINSSLDLLPEVTKWSNPKDLTADTIKLTGVADAVVGAPSCKSGRTTGWSCGEVTGIGAFFVGGRNSESNPKDIRGVLGFESTLTVNAGPGDSGGPTISGSNALGINSAVGEREGVERLISTSLTNALPYTGGYSVALFVDAPKLTSPADKGTVLTDEAISGTATASLVKITSNGETTELPVINGIWSFPAPSTLPAGGKLKFTAQAINGFNTSKSTSYELTVKEAPLPAPVISNPAADAKIADSLTSIKGTGYPTATVSVTVSGNKTVEDTKDEDSAGTRAVEATDETGTATVDANGNWEYTLDDALSYGEYTVTAAHNAITDSKLESPEAAAKFAVILNKPVITSVADGQGFMEGSTPGNISGTGTAGATVNLSVGDTALSALVADNGRWTVSGLPVLAAGSYPVRASQQLSGATSEEANLVFSVSAPVIEEQGPAVPGPTPAPQPGTPAPDNQGHRLPNTGAAGLGLFAGAGALLTAGGLSALLINRRRRMQDA